MVKGKVENGGKLEMQVGKVIEEVRTFLVFFFAFDF